MPVPPVYFTDIFTYAMILMRVLFLCLRTFCPFQAFFFFPLFFSWKALPAPSPSLHTVKYKTGKYAYVRVYSEGARAACACFEIAPVRSSTRWAEHH